MKKKNVDWYKQAIIEREEEVENNDKIKLIKNDTLRAYYKERYKSDLQISLDRFIVYFEVTYKGQPFVCHRIFMGKPETLMYMGAGILPNGVVTELYYDTFKDLVDIQMEQSLKELNIKLDLERDKND